VTPKRLEKARNRLEGLRSRGSIKSSDLEGLAAMLGRAIDPKRGKHPTWINANYPNFRPVTIPRHGRRDLNRITAQSILDDLEGDIEWFEENERDENHTEEKE